MHREKGLEQRPLPRPALWEIVVGVLGIVTIFAGIGLAKTTGIGWYWWLFVAGAVAEGVASHRIVGARMDAIRARPPL